MSKEHNDPDFYVIYDGNNDTVVNSLYELMLRRDRLSGFYNDYLTAMGRDKRFVDINKPFDYTLLKDRSVLLLDLLPTAIQLCQIITGQPLITYLYTTSLLTFTEFECPPDNSPVKMSKQLFPKGHPGLMMINCFRFSRVDGSNRRLMASLGDKTDDYKRDYFNRWTKQGKT